MSLVKQQQRTTCPRRRRPLAAAALAALLAATGLGLGTTGCAGRGEMAIPAGAKLVSSGKNGLVSYTAANRGNVYVFDDTDKKMIFTHELMRGDRVSVIPNEDVIRINDKTASEQKLVDDHQYQIHFDPAGTTP